ncbi:MAG: Hsp70 family protein, partial [Clostridiales bacterium]|nr:Hsp70 family protein [Clostridiales bacterium]
MRHKVLGIDFGTCFSFPAVMMNGEPRSLLPSKINGGGIPSVFYYDKKMGELTGARAESHGARNPSCIAREVKLRIGGAPYSLDGETYGAREISAKILAGITALANEQFEIEFREPPIHDAVIAVPVKFGDLERKMIRLAAGVPRIDGGSELNIKTFVQEPVAAAIDYGETIKAAEYALVYDLGGGTFDAAIVARTLNERQPYRVVDFDDAEVGGKDFDALFFDHLSERFAAERGIDISTNERAKSDLSKAARNVKEELSDTLETVAEVQFGGVFYEITVTRAEFERVVKPLLDKTLYVAKKLAERNGLLNSPRLHAVMVGGGSYMPCAKTGLAQALGAKTRVHLHRPDKAIAFGAARLGENIGIISQLAPYSYGIGVFTDGHDEISNLIFKKTALPARTGVNAFVTRADGMTEQRVKVYQNSSPDKRVNI